MIRITAAERIETDGFISEVDLTADQTMRPRWRDLKGMPQQGDGAQCGGAAYEDHHSLGMGLKIGLPSGGKAMALGSIINASRGALAVSADVTAGLSLEAGQRTMVKAAPHLGLPTAVEVFDSSL